MVVGARTRRKRIGGRKLVAALLCIGLMMLGDGAAAADQCWPGQQLLTAEGADRIQRGAGVTLVPLPLGTPAPAPATFQPVKGVVRRVALPAGAPKLVALTFDLCEQPYEIAGYQGTLVDYLRDKGIKATFFMGGKWMLTHELRAQQLMADPLFEVANHSWEHRNFRIISGSRLDDEIKGAQVAYESVRERLVKRQCLARDGRSVNKTTAPRLTLFRFPFGACNDKALEAVAENGLIPVQWDVSSADPDKRQTAAAMAEAVLRKVRSGSIVLFHANGRGWHTSEALPEIVSELKRAQFKFVTVSELLRFPGAQWDVSRTCYDARPGDADRYDGLARALEAQYQRFYARFGPSRRGGADSPDDPPERSGKREK